MSQQHSHQQEVDIMANDIAEMIERQLPPNIGFAVQLMCMGSDGCTSFVSNVDRIAVYEVWAQIMRQDENDNGNGGDREE